LWVGWDRWHPLDDRGGMVLAIGSSCSAAGVPDLVKGASQATVPAGHL